MFGVLERTVFVCAHDQLLALMGERAANMSAPTHILEYAPAPRPQEQKVSQLQIQRLKD
jgi:hypothetical protein